MSGVYYQNLDYNVVGYNRMEDPRNEWKSLEKITE